MNSDTLFDISLMPDLLQRASHLESQAFSIDDSNCEEIAEVFSELSDEFTDYIHILLLNVSHVRPFKYRALSHVWKNLKKNDKNYVGSSFWCYLVKNGIEAVHNSSEEQMFQNYLDRSDHAKEDPVKTAIIDGDLEKVIFLSTETDFLKKTITYETDISLIEFAALCGNAQIFKFLMINGASLNPESADKAVSGGNIEIIEICRSHNITFEKSFNTAIKYHHNDIAKWIYEQYIPKVTPDDLLHYIAVYNTPAFYYFFENLPNDQKDIRRYIDMIVGKGQIDMLKYYYKPDIKSLGHDKGPLLGIAAVGYHKSIMDFLLEKNPEHLSEKTVNGKTPLFYAIEGKQIKSVEYLLSRGASPNIRDMQDYSPLYFAVHSNDVEIVDLLLDKRVDINENYPNGKTPLLVAIPHTEMACFLIEKGANIQVKTNSNLTPLMLCVEYGNYEIAKLLLEKGAEIDSFDNNHETALHYASKTSNSSIIELLLSFNADIEARNSHQKTPLHIVAATKFTQTAKALISGNADINAVDDEGRTPLIIAAVNHMTDMFKYLKTCGGNKAAIDIYGKSAYDYQRAARIRN